MIMTSDGDLIYDIMIGVTSTVYSYNWVVRVPIVNLGANEIYSLTTLYKHNYMFHQLICYRVFHLNTLNVLIHTHKSYSEYSLSSIQQFGNEASL